MRIALCALASIVLLASPAAVRPAGAAEQGFWNFSLESRDHPGLEFRRGKKVLFFIGVGRAVGLWIAYPGPPRAEGEATVTIKTDHREWAMKGELTNDHSFEVGNEKSTYFFQWDMGLDRTKEEEFDGLNDLFNRFINSLVDSKEITIVTDAGTVVLPRITISNLRARFGM